MRQVPGQYQPGPDVDISAELEAPDPARQQNLRDKDNSGAGDANCESSAGNFLRSEMLAGQKFLDVAAQPQQQAARSRRMQLLDAGQSHFDPTVRRAVLVSIGELFLKPL